MGLSMAWHARGNANADFVKAAASSEIIPQRSEVNFATAMTLQRDPAQWPMHWQETTDSRR